MARSISEIRATPTESRPEAVLPICLAPHLSAKVSELAVKVSALTKVPSDGGEPTGPPTRLVDDGGRAERDAAAAELEAAIAEMEKEEGSLTVRATDDGAWRIWANANPARKEDEPGHARDVEVTGGYCNADALIANLGTYAYAWEGERLAEGDWELLAKNISGPDKKTIAATVVSLLEQPRDFPVWLGSLRETLTALLAADSVVRQGSAPADS